MAKSVFQRVLFVRRRREVEIPTEEIIYDGGHDRVVVRGDLQMVAGLFCLFEQLLVLFSEGWLETKRFLVCLKGSISRFSDFMRGNKFFPDYIDCFRNNPE